jgi:hypothetical protein
MSQVFSAARSLGFIVKKGHIAAAVGWAANRAWTGQAAWAATRAIE